MVVTFMFLGFAVLGLGMAVLVQVHLRVGAGRKNSAILDYASENGIKQALAEVSDRLDTGETLREITTEREAAFRADVLGGGTAIVEDCFGWIFPRTARETWKSAEWESTISCAQENIEDRSEFTSVSYGFKIDSVGSLAAFKPRRASSCDASLEAMVGRLPLPSIPLLIDKEMTAQEESGYMTKNGISFSPGPRGGIAPRLQSVAAPIIPDFPESHLGEALRIRIFRPEDLTPAVIRRAVGLEATNDPVPEGVYLIRDDLGLGGVFIQGDVDEMIPAVDGNWQAIRFRQDERDWVLKFSPAMGKTSFLAPETSESFNLVPAGTICVNGRILSLGGGIVEPDGGIRMVADEARPSILFGVNLTIISSEGVTLTSHLISQGVRWKDGVPYIRDGSSQLVIYSTGKDMANGEEREARVTISAESPANMAIQASLISRGAGVVAEGRGKTVDVLGGIQAADVSGGGNAVRITARNGIENGPLTARPMIYISGFHIREWREY